MRIYEVGNIIFNDWIVIKSLHITKYSQTLEVEKNEFGIVDCAIVKIVEVENENELDRLRELIKLKSSSTILLHNDFRIEKFDSKIQIILKFPKVVTLTEYLAKNGISEHTVVQLLRTIGKALQTCKKQRIVHGNIKPSNIFVSDDGHFLLGDFFYASQKEINIFQQYDTQMHQSYSISGDSYALAKVAYYLLNQKRNPFDKRFPEISDQNTRMNALRIMSSGTKVPEPEFCSKILWKILDEIFEMNGCMRNADLDKFLSKLENISVDDKVLYKYDITDEYGNVLNLALKDEKEEVFLEKQNREVSLRKTKPRTVKYLIIIIIGMVIMGLLAAVLTLNKSNNDYNITKEIETSAIKSTKNNTTEQSSNKESETELESTTSGSTTATTTATSISTTTDGYKVTEQYKETRDSETEIQTTTVIETITITATTTVSTERKTQKEQKTEEETEIFYIIE